VRVVSKAEGDNWNGHSLEDYWKPRVEEKKNVIEPPERENKS